jgi:flagellar hook assembly protein FlgD
MLGDIILLSKGFSPNSVTDNTMGVQFSLSETALVSAHIYDENNSLITTLFDRQLFSDGIKEIWWNGYDSQNEIAPSGHYYVMIQAYPVGLPDSPIQKQSPLFILDAAPLEITIADEKPVYYISPDEPSSMGVQDSLHITASFNKEATVSANIVDQQEMNVRDIISMVSVADENEVSLDWDGMDNENMYVKDDRYELIIEALDMYGNRAVCVIPVIVDNNRADDELNCEGITGLEEHQVDDDTDTVINRLSLEKIDGGYVIAWNDLDYENRYIVVYDEAGNIRREQFSVNPDSAAFSWEYCLSKTNNGFILIWLEADGGLHFDVLKAQRFDDFGKEIGERFEITRIAGSSYEIGDIACKETNNGYAVAWAHNNGNTLWVQFFDDFNKAITDPHIIAEQTTGYVTLESMGSGVMALWQVTQEGSPDSYVTYVKRIEQDDSLSGNPVAIYTGDEDKSALAKLSSGFVVVGPYPGSSITAIQLDDDGNTTGSS